MLITICNLGCAKNQVDGETMAGWLAAAGHQLTDQPEKAHAILVNTCTFIKDASQEAIATILDMARFKRTGACRLLIVCGCFSERYRTQVARMFPEVDYWFGVHTWRREIVRVFGKPEKGSPPRRLVADSPSQYLKIAEGCSRRCSFCIIPVIRGPFRSRPAAEIITEAKLLAERGVLECVLVSQDTSAYGRDRGWTLERLVERLLRDTPLRWIRLMYLHPSAVSDDLLRMMASESRVCPYLDIPLQHVAEPVLRRMRRYPVTEKGVRRLIERIRSMVPQAAIRSTFIVGFPGETEEHFRQLLGFLRWARLDRVGAFVFSAEEGTPAFAMKPRVAYSTAQRRRRELMELQQELSLERNQSRVGTIVRVLIEGESQAQAGWAEGRTPWDAPEVDGAVHVKGVGPAPAIVPVRITEAGPYDLLGEAVD